MITKVLFFDTFIIKKSTSLEEKYNTYDGRWLLSKPARIRDKEIRNIRGGSYSYRHKSQIDIVKYTLSSYSSINWDQVIIRYVCEDEEDTSQFHDFVENLFPNAIIQNERSDSATKYFDALLMLKDFDDPWVFFSPNNDHPCIGNPYILDDLLSEAEDVERIYPESIVSVLYSHFTEGLTCISPSNNCWGSYSNNFPKVLGETENAFIVKNSKFMSDSIKLFRLSSLLDLFQSDTNGGRVIILEHLESYQSSNLIDITLSPKKELCRHYDSYTHVIETTPPLFIPDGFFDNKIKIRYGYENLLRGYVNVNPFGQYSFLQNGNADLRCLISQLPFFWRDKIETIDVSEEISKSIISSERIEAFSYFREINDPYRNIPIFFNYIYSFYKYYLHQPLFFIVRLVYRYIKRFI